jgi:hypothetical protein
LLRRRAHPRGPGIDNYFWRGIFLIDLSVEPLVELVLKLVEGLPSLRRLKSGEMRLDTVGLPLPVRGLCAQLFS